MNWRLDLGNDYWYDNKPDYYSIDDVGIARVEKAYKCRFVAEWNIINSDGRVMTQPVLLFWNDIPHDKGSNWMGMYRDSVDSNWYVRDGITASRLPIECVVSNDKQVLFSKNRHDFRTSHDRSITVDGGRDYTRVLGAIRNEHVWMIPQQGELKLVPETMAHLMMEKNK